MHRLPEGVGKLGRSLRARKPGGPALFNGIRMSRLRTLELDRPYRSRSEIPLPFPLMSLIDALPIDLPSLRSVGISTRFGTVRREDDLHLALQTASGTNGESPDVGIYRM